MDYKKEIGRRIRLLRDEQHWTLDELSRRTGDVLSLKRISNYESGLRMPGPQEAVILAKAFGARPAYIMAVDDIQTPISAIEEKLVKNWRTLNERDRMDVYRHVETLSLQNRDPAADLSHYQVPPPTPAMGRMPKVAIHKRVRQR